MSNMRKITIKATNRTGVEEIKNNVLIPLLGENALTVAEDSISWDQSLLDPVMLKALERTLIERAKMGLLGVNEEGTEIDKTVIDPGLDLALTSDCIYYVAQSQASLNKFVEEVLTFSGIEEDRAVFVTAPHSPQVLQIQKPVIVVCNLTPQEMGKIRSNSNFKKWGIAGGKILSNVSSGAGLMAHTIFSEAVAPTAVNLSIAGAKMAKTALVTSTKIGDVLLDEGSKAILEIATTFSESNGYGMAKERIAKAWAIASKKDPSNASNDVISF